VLLKPKSEIRAVENADCYNSEWNWAQELETYNAKMKLQILLKFQELSEFRHESGTVSCKTAIWKTEK
jgi:hypothetical protein